MPMVGEDTAFLIRLISITGASLYPLALGLLLPVFMHAIVLEKEEKLLEMMLMNGMRMKFYWISTFFFLWISTLVTFSLFYIFGYYQLALSFFTETQFSILVSFIKISLFVYSFAK